ncbi:MAG: hypothetical protein M3O46_14735 [Myxococcota bacterium]|nr:hypothetical protein [Myxococcota bacterium]
MGGRSVVPLLYANRLGAARMARGRAIATARSQVGAAIRIPERAGAQLRLVFPSASPRLFVHEGARQALERKLRGAFPGPVILSITDNRHSIITHRVQRDTLHARVHHMFLDAPPHVVDSLVRYVIRGDRDASATLGDYIDANGSSLARRKRNAPLVTRGKHHDLLSLFDDINERYFDGAVNALITWGKRPTTRAVERKTIKLGSYSVVDRLIRVHPSLDRTWVPRYFVAYIVYHEMLHHVIPGSRGLGRVNLHPPEFKEREQDFRHFGRAIEWEKRYVARLLHP